MGVAEHSFFHSVVESPQLDGTGRTDALPDVTGAFACTTLGHVAVVNGGHFDVDVHAVEEGTGDAGAVALHGERETGALVRRIIPVPAGAGIHRADEHEPRWKGEGDGSSTDSDGVVL